MDAPNVELISQWLWFIVQIVKLVAWPLVIGLLAWWNRVGILALLNSLARRALKIKGPGGIEASLDATPAQDSDAGTKITEAPIVPASAPAGSQVPTLPATPPPALPNASLAVEHLEGELASQLAGIEVGHQNTLLLRALAETRVRAGHEAIYNRIFGSQIDAIQRLDARGGATVEEARQYYESLIPRFPAMYPAYPFESWLGFMVGVGLVSQEGDRLNSTLYGHDFVVYLAENRLTPEKPN